MAVSSLAVLWCTAVALAVTAIDMDAVEFPDPKDRLIDAKASQTGTPFSLSRTLGDHMILQRAPLSAVVWGFAPPGTVVTATFRGLEHTCTAGSDAVWRVRLPPTVAGGPYTIHFLASTGETALLSDVLFGDVYLCGGQSNMQFSLGGNEHAASYIKEADGYPNIRLFTVGQGTASRQPLMDLKTVLQNWTVAGSKSVSDGSDFHYFSAVCWFFGKGVYDGLGGQVPLGLISNNWGGTKVEQWMSPDTSLECGHASSGELYGAMIAPYLVGPMAVTGFTWYQGEADLADTKSPNNNYTCTQTAMISQWRKEFQVPRAFFAVVQLSTWIPKGRLNLLLPELRDQQLVSGDLIPNFAYATNADYGAGDNIHPPFKQYPGARLANAALAVVYGRAISWRSPTYASAMEISEGELIVWLNDVTDAGLVLRPAHNANPGCADLGPYACGWASLQFNDPVRSWVNASVAIGSDKMTMVLRATPPVGATDIIASSYGWGAIPMMTVYRADMSGKDGQLPVLPWNRNVTTGRVENKLLMTV
eukprot:CAMPEP_0179051066 /NCGR_PEP_ID=MMETSP0796-20121207/21055_1 /TAXON_ID=73915 /ORGANISM="Pyrodinium bahamense, Strain pbaha01" /LENGTH=532 /DNA_ID=CAMNT_0020747599 /DNA_START=60 /DNA_END=1658 /DNA_ORIENTATION=-